MIEDDTEGDEEEDKDTLGTCFCNGEAIGIEPFASKEAWSTFCLILSNVGVTDTTFRVHLGVASPLSPPTGFAVIVRGDSAATELLESNANLSFISRRDTWDTSS